MKYYLVGLITNRRVGGVRGSAAAGRRCNGEDWDEWNEDTIRLYGLMQEKKSPR